MKARPAVFLDRDGTLIEERSYPRRREDIVPFAGVGAALHRLNEAGFLCIVLSNQSAVARGMLDEEELGALHDDLRERLASEGGELDAIYYCPHHPEGSSPAYAQRCGCRKPAHGLFELACFEHEIDLSRSAFVGDAVRDMFHGVAPEALRVLVRSGHGLPPDAEAHCDVIVDDVLQAVDLILQRFPPETDTPDDHAHS
ncbi:MAG: D,D-heptose 1,7-bisphosphate phosphatase [Planctomycetota bacterium]|nr:MAG: D,D-heptose 1,7-bisphosphate phosphatase [Planctomycetota bacterium]